MAQALLFVEDVHVEKNGSPILRGVTHQVRPGRSWMLGRNGAGKSSLAYSIMGIGGYRPSRGQIQFDGEDILPFFRDGSGSTGYFLAWQHPARYEGIPFGIICVFPHSVSPRE
jgi:Fe-S cluster assembly ATP-binding protein